MHFALASADTRRNCSPKTPSLNLKKSCSYESIYFPISTFCIFISKKLNIYLHLLRWVLFLLYSLLCFSWKLHLCASWDQKRRSAACISVAIPRSECSKEAVYAWCVLCAASMPAAKWKNKGDLLRAEYFSLSLSYFWARSRPLLGQTRHAGWQRAACDLYVNAVGRTCAMGTAARANIIRHCVCERERDYIWDGWTDIARRQRN